MNTIKGKQYLLSIVHLILVPVPFRHVVLLHRSFCMNHRAHIYRKLINLLIACLVQVVRRQHFSVPLNLLQLSHDSSLLL